MNNCVSQPLAFEFDSGPVIDTWLPGETLYSLGCRHHMLAGNIKAADTCLQLFGHPRIGSAHDLPGRVGQFAQRTKGRLGAAEDIIRRHTILPYYLAFRSSKDEVDAIASMTCDSIGSLKAKLGILATRFGAAHPLKICLTCLQNDQDQHHLGYWHVEHQIPGVWLCPLHCELLEVAHVKWMGVDRFGWSLPSESEFTRCIDKKVSQQPDLDVLKRLADCSVALWSLQKGFHFSTEKLGNLISCTLKDHGLSSDSGRLRTKPFSAAITAVTHTLLGIHELSNLPSSIDQAESQFSRIVIRPRSSVHPIKYQILILALFGTWESFWNKWVEKTAPENISSPNSLPSASLACLDNKYTGSDHFDKRSAFISSLAANNTSMNSLAQQIGISVSTAMSWAASAGIATKRRPKVLTPDVRKKLIRVLRRGIDKMSVAQGFGISIQTVTTTLRTEVGLHERWVQARFKCAQNKARKAWTETARKLPNPTSKTLRSLQPAVFSWLYRNDRSWLEQFASQLVRPHKSNYASIDWDIRDRAIAQAISAAVLNWHIRQPNTRLTNARLCQLVPGLKSRLSELDRLPLTRVALSQKSDKNQNQSTKTMAGWI